MYCTNAKRKCILDVSSRSQSRNKLECIVRILSVSVSVGYLIQVSIANEAQVYCTNAKRKCVLDVLSRSQSRNKLECMVRILSVSARCIFHSGLNHESSLSVLHEY